MSWHHLSEINRELFGKSEPFTAAFDCFSVFDKNAQKGILLIFANKQIVSIKLSSNPETKLKVSDLARIKGINGK